MYLYSEALSRFCQNPLAGIPPIEPEPTNIEKAFKELKEKITKPVKDPEGGMSPKELLDYLCLKLHKKPRSGLVDFKVKNPETIWEHCLDSMKRIEEILPDCGITDPNEINHAKAVMFFHDFGEAIAHDITPTMGIDKNDKRGMETATIQFFREHVYLGEEIARYWEEYENNETRAAHICHGFDKVQHLYVILDCEARNASPYDMTEFWDTAWAYLTDSPHAEHYGPLRKIYKDLEKKRLDLMGRSPENFEGKKKLTRAELSEERKQSYVRRTYSRIAALKKVAETWIKTQEERVTRPQAVPAPNRGWGPDQACTAA